MRIIQIIDSLETGGAERMAVNYANALAEKIEFSGLVVTREEGLLQNQINKNVAYLYLNKKGTIDFKALFNLRKFVLHNKIDIIHAHSTSFFLAFLLKLIYPKLKLIWHDHYGDSEFLNKRPKIALKFIIPFFNGIIAVNQKLKVWSQHELNFKNVIYLPNFPSPENEIIATTNLNGIDKKRIVCLANLRPQKNHFLLLETAKKLKQSHPEWSFHLVGKDFEDEYSNQIKKEINEFKLEKSVFLYNSKQDIKNILNQSTIAILTSQSEGLPVALLEYGLNKKAVVVTNVGEIKEVIDNNVNGFLVESNNVGQFYTAILKYIENESIIENFSINLKSKIDNYFSEESIIQQYISWIKKQ